MDGPLLMHLKSPKKWKNFLMAIIGEVFWSGLYLSCCLCLSYICVIHLIKFSSCLSLFDRIEFPGIDVKVSSLVIALKFELVVDQ